MRYEDYVLADPTRQVAVGHALRLNGDEVITGWAAAAFVNYMDLNMVEMKYEPSLSNGTHGVITISAKSMSDDGVAGIYSGSRQLTYPKVDIQQLIPYPIRYSNRFPTQWGYIRQWLKAIYKLNIEIQDIAYIGLSSTMPSIGQIDLSTPLSDTHEVDFEIAGPDEYVVLVVAATSKRFAAGGVVNLNVTPTSDMSTSMQTWTQGELGVVSYSRPMSLARLAYRMN